MILAAGLGTRLRPLTDTRPKALVEINGRTLLEITLTRLRSFGINEVIVNVHHFADLVVDCLKAHNNFGMRIEVSREDDLLLDTGGGLKKAAWFFLEDSHQDTAVAVGRGEQNKRALAPEVRKTSSDRNDDPFLLHNVDVISTIDLRRMLQFHNEHRALATLAVQSRESSRLLLFNDQNLLVGRAATGSPALEKDVTPSEARKPAKAATQSSGDPRSATRSSYSPPATRHWPIPLAFSGIHIISPRLLPMLTEQGVFSIIDAYVRLAAQGEKILAFCADEYYWRDLGRPADLSQAALDLRQRFFE
jgi:mannose-1-phosphate guanylyltransferase